MRNPTRIAYNAYIAHLAQLNGVIDATTKFSVEPSIEQKLEDRIQQSADFLKAVNVVPVDQQSGEVLGLGVTAPVASRTNTNTKDREPRSVHSLTKRDYFCRQTNFDTFVRYQELDIWAKFPDFQTRIRDHVVRQIARDRLMIGFNGTSAAADTDLVANPLLQDVNIGWLQHIRTEAPERVLAGVKVGAAAGSDFRNADAAVFDAGNELLDEWYKEDSDIVAVMGRELLTDKYLGLLNAADSDAPTEKAALNTMLMTKAVGGRKAILVPFFPARSILLTKPSNLSIYWQTGTRRRQVEDQPKRDRIVDFQSVNEDYVIEDLGACALIEGILIPDGAGGWV